MKRAESNVQVVLRYAEGDQSAADPAIQFLRGIGERAARRAGLQAADVDALGVDFAAQVVTQMRDTLLQWRGDPESFLGQKAAWMARTRAGQERRRSWRLVSLLDAAGLAGAQGETEPDQSLRDEQLAIESALTHLRETEREVIELCCLDGCTDREASDILGVSQQTVRQRLSRARRHLRAVLGDLLPQLSRRESRRTDAREGSGRLKSII